MRQTVLVAAAAFFVTAPVGSPAPLAKAGYDRPALQLAPQLAPLPAVEGVPLTLLTYNVKGLPWPVTGDRTAELAAIGDRLNAMRRAGGGPDVVVLQEAFSSDARAIAARAGYPHIAYGPDSDAVAPADAEQQMPDTYRWRGEGFGSWLSSGLVLMSRYPITATRRAAFPRTACAGYDCLANKGVLLVRIAVPGLPVPVEVMTAHMNSRLPTRTPLAHANQAFVRQMAALDRFVATNADRRLPMIFGGDLNLDSDPQRIAALRQSNARWTGLKSTLALTAAPASISANIPTAIFAICGKPRFPCHPGIGFASIATGKRNNDWQMAFASPRIAIQPTTAAIRFMPDPAGRTLSDHQAVMVTYRLNTTAPRPGKS